jgi:protein-S-isoprenylcysteine O-methyltransferase Ste14
VISIIIAFFQIVSAFEIRWSAGLLAMVMATVGYLIFMLFVRVTLESLVARVRTAENTTLLLEQKH